MHTNKAHSMKKYLIEAEAVGNSGPDRPFKGAYADFGDEMPVCMVMPRGQLMPLIRATEVTAIKQNREHEHEIERICHWSLPYTGGYEFILGRTLMCIRIW